MSNKNSDRIDVVAAYLQINADSHNGKTIKQISIASGIPISTTQRIIYQPGFMRALAPRYPTSYFYSPSNVVKSAKAVIQAKPISSIKHSAVHVTQLGEVKPPAPLPPDLSSAEIVYEIPTFYNKGGKDTLTNAVKGVTDLRDIANAFKSNGTLNNAGARKAFESIEIGRRAAMRLVELFDLLLFDPAMTSPEYWTVFLTEGV